MKQLLLQAPSFTEYMIHSFFDAVNKETFITQVTTHETWGALFNFEQNTLYDKLHMSLHLPTAQITACRLIHDDYQIVYIDETNCVIMGQFMLHVSNADGIQKEIRHRASFVYVCMDARLVLKHLNMSAPDISTLQSNQLGKRYETFKHVLSLKAKSALSKVDVESKDVPYLSPYNELIPPVVLPCDADTHHLVEAKSTSTTNGSNNPQDMSDICAYALQLFEQSNDFSATIQTLLETVGHIFTLDRITIIQANMQTDVAMRVHQWLRSETPATLEKSAPFARDDFFYLYNSYDRYGLAVMYPEEMSEYSPFAQSMLLQGNAKTALYAAMYGDGKYNGAIAYVDCTKRRIWSVNEKKVLSELAKIISVNFGKYRLAQSSHRQVAYISNYDQLTNLANFTKFKADGNQMLKKGHKEKLVLVYSDIKNFKYINEMIGFTNGDQLLKQYAYHITQGRFALRLSARVNADQFISLTPYHEQDDFLKMIRFSSDSFCNKLNQSYEAINLMIRSGIYFIEQDCSDITTAIDRANSARKSMLHLQKSTYNVYNVNIALLASKEYDLTSRMQNALIHKEFVVYLQPKVELKTRQIIGAEALVRWKMRDGTLIQPNDFIPLFERNGFITTLDYYVLEEVLCKMKEWKKAGHKLLPISVNISSLHAKDPEMFPHILGKIKHYDIAPHLIELELTETSFIEQSMDIVNMMQGLRGVGFKTSIDDFGAGYSVLNMIIDMPTDIVKIDKEFITTCENSERGIIFFTNIIQMIRNLGYTVLCEGIETLEQAKLLEKTGCELGQGYIFSRPLPVEEFEKRYIFKTEPVH